MPTNKARFNTFPHLLSAGLRQQIHKLTVEAERFRAVREFGKVAQLADRLMFILPVHLSSIADYYQAVALRHTPEATVRMETLTEGPLAPIRARAQLALGTQAYLAGDYDQSEARYARIQFSSPDRIGLIHLAKMRAVLQSIRGNHEQALRELQGVWRLVRTANTPLHYDILNSVCVELLSIGDVKPAYTLIKGVLASPFAQAHPEWIESHREIARAAYESATVSVPTLPGNVSRLADYRMRRDVRLDYEVRRDLCNQMVFGSIRRMMDRADMSLPKARHIISLLNS